LPATTASNFRIGNAISVTTFECLVGDGLLDEVDAVHGDVRIELAGDADVVAARGDVDAVRAAGLGREMQDALGRGRFERDDLDAVDRLELPGGDQLFGALPVDDVQVVEVEL
jgi:hypothetical protein